MFSRSVRVAGIRGIQVSVEPALPVFALLVLWVFSARFVAAHGYPLALAMGTAAMALFFLSILAHELGHALEARHRGLEVVGITLSLFGGVTEMHAHDHRPRDELAIAAIGPYVSLVCAAVFGLLAAFADDLLPGAVATPVGEVAGLLGWVNLLLAIFNLVPGAPLDGGRVLRALLWWLLGDRRRALRISCWSGQALGVGLIGLAVFSYWRQPSLAVSALLLGVIGLFLFDAARREARQAGVDEFYADRTVGELLGAVPDAIPEDQPLDRLTHVVTPGPRLVPVVDLRAGADPTVTGLLDLGALDLLDDEQRTTRTAGDLAIPIDGLPSVGLDDDLHTLIDRLRDDEAVVVEHDGRPVAGISGRQAARAIAELRATGPDRRERPTQDRVGS